MLIKNINKYLITYNEHNKLCKVIFKILSCNVLWIINLSNKSLHVLATDHDILNYYIDKKYYLSDPSIKLESNNKKSLWQITVGTDSDEFNKSGFLYDLYKIFHIEEFVSIEKKVKSEQYCFRFFTKNNRFIFINQLINNALLIKYFIIFISKTLKLELKKQARLGLIQLN